MSSKIIYIALYILQCIIFNRAQNALIMTPQDFCVPIPLTLRCLNNYIVVIRSAFHGVSQNSRSCSYTPGDCIVDFINNIACITNSMECSIFVPKKRLPQCHDQYSSYFHIEYDCIPTSMNDTSKEYNICGSSSDIQTNNGIIKSPGYPSPFQPIKSECSRAINALNDKVVRLWISDLYIGSANTECANDYVYVVDSIQTYKECGQKRLAYPYLCSSKIIIQYLTKTDFPTYRGMRMYFEVVDRSMNDNCPQVTITPVPNVTTTVGPNVSTNRPVYVLLGIASPIRRFQLCPGK